MFRDTGSRVSNRKTYAAACHDPACQSLLNLPFCTQASIVLAEFELRVMGEVYESLRFVITDH